MTLVRSTARRIGAGKVALYAYHRPLSLIRQSVAEGGPIEQWRTANGHRQMLAAAASLPQLAASHGPTSANISFLSGPRFWHLTVFCFVSLQLVCPFLIIPTIYDDGGMTADVRSLFLRVVPWARFVNSDETEARLDRILPEVSFPSLRARRREYPHLRKLIDIHVGSTGPQLVADSDMLFFREPSALLEWFDSPRPIHMQDTATHYGYPVDYLSELTARPVPEPVNVGLYALDGADIDWERVEYWCKRQLEDHGPHYFQEQALTAMLLAGKSPRALPRSEYIVKPTHAEGRAPGGVLHHYVSESKRAYFQYGWRRVFEKALGGAIDKDGADHRRSVYEHLKKRFLSVTPP